MIVNFEFNLAVYARHLTILSISSMLIRNDLVRRTYDLSDKKTKISAITSPARRTPRWILGMITALSNHFIEHHPSSYGDVERGDGPLHRYMESAVCHGTMERLDAFGLCAEEQGGG